MGALVDLVAKSVKNTLLETLRKPGKLVLYLVVIVAIIGMAVLSIFTGEHASTHTPLFWFEAAFFAFVALFMILSVVRGLSQGDAIFDLNDVNFLFVSPISPQKILLYGVTKLIKTAFFAGFFLLFQSNTLSQNFGIGFGGMLLIAFIFMFCVAVDSIITLLVYSYTNGRPKRKRIVKLATAAVFLPLLISLTTAFARTNNLSAAVESAVNSPGMLCVPLAGWAGAGATAIFSGQVWQGLLYLGAILLTGAMLVVVIIRSKLDYYEDVLFTTETAFEKKRALSEGNMQSAIASSKRVKVKATGISGHGANTFLFKHIRESFRENKFGFLGISSVFMVAGAAAAAALMPEGSLIMVLQIAAWIQIILVGMGRGLRELYSHYIYLVPASSFSKIIWSNLEVMVKTLVESVLVFGLAGVISRAPLSTILLAIVVYTLFSLALLGINYMSIRFLTADLSKGILLLIYYFGVILLMAPGLAAALIVGFSIDGQAGTVAGLSILAVWETVLSLVCFWLSRGVLHTCDMQVASTK